MTYIQTQTFNPILNWNCIQIDSLVRYKEMIFLFKYISHEFDKIFTLRVILILKSIIYDKGIPI